MSATQDLERRIAAFYATEAPDRAPAWVLARALDTIHATPQRGTRLGRLWKMPTKASFARLSVAAVAVVAVGLVGLSLVRLPAIGPTTSAPASHSPAPSSPSPSPSVRPSPSVGYSRFDSTFNGISIDYPSGWTTKAATEPWGGKIAFDAHDVDVMFDPTLQGDLYIAAVSEPVGLKAPREWVHDHTDSVSLGICYSGGAGGTGDGFQGNPAWFQDCHEPSGGGGHIVIFATPTRGYIIYLHVAAEPRVPGGYDGGWFEGGVLGTVELRPEQALDDVPPSVPPSASVPASPAPDPLSEAERIIADGGVEAFATTGSGAMLTVWGTCHDLGDTACGHAWRLGAGSHTQATGMVGPGDGSCCTRLDAVASADGFIVLRLGGASPLAIHIALDGASAQLPMGCADARWTTPTAPGRLALVQGHIVDTVAASVCETARLGGRPFGLSGAITPEGMLWYLLDNDPDLSDTLSIGRYDGAQWRYHDFTGNGGSSTSLLAAAGSTVAVIQVSEQISAQHDPLVGFATSTDAGATWSEVVDPNVLERDFPFSFSANPDDWLAGGTQLSMAFAGTSVLYVADWRGDLWRSTDLGTFSRVPVAGAVQDLQADGDTVIAWIDDTGMCGGPSGCLPSSPVRILADGTVEHITTN